MKNHPISAIVVLLALAVLFPSCLKEPWGPIYNKKLWSERVAPIIVGCETDYEKAKAIYDWMSENIIYDYTYSIGHADECWEKKTGVCNAFSELYVNLAKGCDLSVEKIVGIVGNGGGHAWNKVKTEKGWILLDVTWGSCFGHIDNHDNGNGWDTCGEMRRVWFDVDPSWMIFTHFPNHSNDQLMSSPISRQVFFSLPHIDPSLGAWGWNAEKTLAFFLRHPHAIAPILFAFPNYCWDTNVFLDYPCSMEEGQEYTIRIRNLNPEYPPIYGNWDVKAMFIPAQHPQVSLFTLEDQALCVTLLNLNPNLNQNPMMECSECVTRMSKC